VVGVCISWLRDENTIVIGECGVHLAKRVAGGGPQEQGIDVRVHRAPGTDRRRQ
jgi:hypothetical protein